MSPQIEIQLIAVLVAVACALPGTFLVLRNMAMMSDSITHTILLGIVLVFFITKDLSSPWLIIGAGLMGVITVWLTQLIHHTKLVSEDSAIGIIFPFLFAAAIILLTRYTGSIHLDTDSVLLGELAFAPFQRMMVGTMDIGAKAIYISGIVLLINIFLIVVFYKELQIVTFDPILSLTLGFLPALVHYGLMSVVSITTVTAFEAVGSILVVSFMIGPPATAYLITDNLKEMLLLSTGFSIFSALTGYRLASIFDVSIAGSMAMVIGVVFLAVFVAGPKQGLISAMLRKRKQRIEFADNTLLLHLLHHSKTLQEREEAGLDTIQSHLYWQEAKMKKVMNRLLEEEMIICEDNILKLTDQGRERGIGIDKQLFG